jgi:hypothetical protein
VGGRGGFFYVNDANELFLYHNGGLVGPAPLEELYRLELNSTGAAQRRRRRLSQTEGGDATNIVSADTDGSALWLVLGNGWVPLARSRVVCVWGGGGGSV